MIETYLAKLIFCMLDFLPIGNHQNKGVEKLQTLNHILAPWRRHKSKWDLAMIDPHIPPQGAICQVWSSWLDATWLQNPNQSLAYKLVDRFQMESI